jgi:hypothetical protein
VQGCELGCLDAGRIVVLCSEVIIHPEAAPSRDVHQDVVACAVMCRCRYRRRLHAGQFSFDILGIWNDGWFKVQPAGASTMSCIIYIVGSNIILRGSRKQIIKLLDLVHTY